MAYARPDILRDQLQKRITAALKEHAMDETRLNQEILYHIDRLDITEEITRLQSHIEAFRDKVHDEASTSGKVLEFLAQEMQREVTTIGNKARMQEIAEHVVSLKANLERIREQLLNIE